MAGAREDAIRKMRWALAQYVILGVTTNLPFLQDVLGHPAFVAGEISTGFVAEHFSDWNAQCPPDLPDEALIAAALAELAALSQPGDAGQPAGDAHSPWGRADGFRIGGA